jgi:hypothetical protein
MPRRRLHPGPPRRRGHALTVHLQLRQLPAGPAQLNASVLCAAARLFLAAERCRATPRRAAGRRSSCPAAREPGRAAEGDADGDRHSAARKMWATARISPPLSCAGLAGAEPGRSCAASRGFSWSPDRSEPGVPRCGPCRRSYHRQQVRAAAHIFACHRTHPVSSSRAAAHTSCVQPHIAARPACVRRHTSFACVRTLFSRTPRGLFFSLPNLRAASRGANHLTNRAEQPHTTLPCASSLFAKPRRQTVAVRGQSRVSTRSLTGFAQGRRQRSASVRENCTAGSEPRGRRPQLRAREGIITAAGRW